MGFVTEVAEGRKVMLKRDIRKGLMNDAAIKAEGDVTLWWRECLKLFRDTWKAVSSLRTVF